MNETERLEPCPFCQEPLFIRTGVNGYGRCDTEGCWMHDRACTVPLGDPCQVAAWNTRVPHPAHEPMLSALEALCAAPPVVEAYHHAMADCDCAYCRACAVAALARRTS